MVVLGITVSDSKYIDDFKNLGKVHYESEFLKVIVISTKLKINEVLSMDGVKKVRDNESGKLYYSKEGI